MSYWAAAIATLVVGLFVLRLHGPLLDQLRAVESGSNVAVALDRAAASVFRGAPWVSALFIVAVGVGDVGSPWILALTVTSFYVLGLRYFAWSTARRPPERCEDDRWTTEYRVWRGGILATAGIVAGLIVWSATEPASVQTGAAGRNVALLVPPVLVLVAYIRSLLATFDDPRVSAGWKIVGALTPPMLLLAEVARRFGEEAAATAVAVSVSALAAILLEAQRRVALHAHSGSG